MSTPSAQVPLDQVGRDRRRAGAGERARGACRSARLMLSSTRKSASAIARAASAGDGLAAVELGLGDLAGRCRSPSGRRAAADPGRLLHADGDAGIEASPRCAARRRTAVGATSRTFSGTVSMLSAKLAMAPERSGRKTVKVRSATWQSGRKASCSSSVPSGMKASALRELEDDVAVREHRALGLAGGARGVDQDRELLGPCEPRPAAPTRPGCAAS